MKNSNNTIKIYNLEEIGTDQLIWDIENSKDFFVYELNNDDENVEILVKIIKENDSFF
ncbi:MAG: hypothetical protein IKL15_00545 [Mycoplasmataceae bacterium]|nr:hypothetical protein [Mycoplasmataceae bacterium]MBR2998959.1 hypothetical protein [Mycoplasmataceae bacterium]MBR3259677.1 hypothetical protein [Mycoplasmataceae bacterium]MBR3348115.1 hypothetical protein [Mycoplasmataceae bacterium]MBR3571139.1 hypothetical protein [Mycoplasmataceae bacterium]